MGWNKIQIAHTMGRRVRGEGGEVWQLLVQQNKANLKSEGPAWTENHDMDLVRFPTRIFLVGHLMPKLREAN